MLPPEAVGVAAEPPGAVAATVPAGPSGATPGLVPPGPIGPGDAVRGSLPRELLLSPASGGGRGNPGTSSSGSAWWGSGCRLQLPGGGTTPSPPDSGVGAEGACSCGIPGGLVRGLQPRGDPYRQPLPREGVPGGRTGTAVGDDVPSADRLLAEGRCDRGRDGGPPRMARSLAASHGGGSCGVVGSRLAKQKLCVFCALHAGCW